MLRVEIGDSRGAVGGRSAAWLIWIKVEQLNKRDSNSVVGCFAFFSSSVQTLPLIDFNAIFQPAPFDEELLRFSSFCTHVFSLFTLFIHGSDLFDVFACNYGSRGVEKLAVPILQWSEKQRPCTLVTPKVYSRWMFTRLLIFSVYLLSNYKEREGFLLECSLYTCCPRIIDNIMTKCKIQNKSMLLGNMLFHFQTRNSTSPAIT